jgi:serine/threonine-protein kinase
MPTQGPATAAIPRTTAMPTTAGATGAYNPYGYPDGYGQPRNRSGLYALLGFLAIALLVVGGVVAVKALSGGGSSSFSMPDVVGQPLDTGSKLLADKGLKVVLQKDNNAKFSKGAITRTDPVAPAEVKTGQSVTVWYNPLDAEFNMPDMKGVEQQTAANKLAAMGLSVNPTVLTATDPAIAVGNVIKTNPPAGTKVKLGDTVQLIVSAGANQVSVPAVNGLSQADAQTLLGGDNYQFTVTVKEEASDTVEKGRATRTDPAQGTMTDKGTPITLYISTGQASVQVPPLVGLTQAQAIAKLNELGLVPDIITDPLPFGDVNNGRVTAQSPSETQTAMPGDTVRIKVGKAGPAPTTTSSTTTTIPSTGTTGL